MACDVLVCTPGKLLEHIQSTAGFTLRHMRYLVLDEADRLLGNAYHHWVRSILQSGSMDAAHSAGTDDASSWQSDFRVHSNNSDDGNADHLQHHQHEHHLPQYLERRRLCRLLFSATLSDNPGKLALLGIHTPWIIRAGRRSLQDAEEHEHEGSAAVTCTAGSAGVDAGDGAGVAALPSTLYESVCHCEASKKPLMLATLLYEALHAADANTASSSSSSSIAHDDDDHHSAKSVDAEEDANTDDAVAPAAKRARTSAKVTMSVRRHEGFCSRSGDMCIVFASSVETTHRLCRFLQTMNSSSSSSSSSRGDGDGGLLFRGAVAEMSRDLSTAEREDIMRRAEAGEIAVLVSSDHMARGIDLPNVRVVLNYDPPSFARTYVHRVGRTARANREGIAITLVKKGQQGIFKKMLMGLHHHHHDCHHHQGGALASASARSGHPLEKAKVRQVHVQMMMPMQTEALRSIASGIISDDD